MAEKEYIERETAYPLAKKICDAIDSKEFQRLNFGMRILDWIDDLPAADVRPVVVCADCEHNNHCMTQAFVEEASRAPFDRNTFFCADGERMKRNANN